MPTNRPCARGCSFSSVRSLVTLGAQKREKGSWKKMVDTRNYLTHYDPALAVRAAQRADLLPLVSKLEALFQLHLLLLVGIDQERIDNLVASNRKLRWRLGLKPD